ncbi:MAG: NAD(P)-dependent oxidoreductase [Pseudomonadota bacterium]|nr:NAD(P)-dependent oxidoreductase [Pseudomonadota bacterium]
MLNYERILITGAAGKLGHHLRGTLKPLARVLRLTDVAPLQPAAAGEEVRQADLADEAAVFEMMAEVDAVVHLGGIIREAPFADILRSNILGGHNVWEGARRAGVKRIIFASSCHAVGMYRRDERLDASVQHRPDGYYGLSKAFTEDLARLYYDRHGIETACLRIGSCLPEPTGERMLATWLSRPDLTRLVTACLSAPYLGYAVLYGMSENQQTWWDNSHADYIGYRPQDSAEAFRDKLRATPGPLDRDHPAVKYQAGHFAEGMQQ